jgi:hypothetical protein
MEKMFSWEAYIDCNCLATNHISQKQLGMHITIMFISYCTLFWINLATYINSMFVSSWACAMCEVDIPFTSHSADDRKSEPA